jgi:hypothetical protein
LVLETVGSRTERVIEALFRAGVGVFLLATSADGVIHLAGWHQLENATHLGIFTGMVLASLALVMRGSAPIRKEPSYATR